MTDRCSRSFGFPAPPSPFSPLGVDPDVFQRPAGLRCYATTWVPLMTLHSPSRTSSASRSGFPASLRFAPPSFRTSTPLSFFAPPALSAWRIHFPAPRSPRLASRFLRRLVAGFHTRFGPSSPFLATLTVSSSPYPVVCFNHSHPWGFFSLLPHPVLKHQPCGQPFRTEGTGSTREAPGRPGLASLPKLLRSPEPPLHSPEGSWSGSSSPARSSLRASAARPRPTRRCFADRRLRPRRPGCPVGPSRRLTEVIPLDPLASTPLRGCLSRAFPTRDCVLSQPWASSVGHGPFQTRCAPDPPRSHAAVRSRLLAITLRASRFVLLPRGGGHVPFAATGLPATRTRFKL